MVLYRKYRPQKIAEIDSVSVRDRLDTILAEGAIPQAFLFTGPKGTGKTSAARILAKSVNCEKNNGKGEPCGKCLTCISIANNTNLDVLEIDAASNRGIDEIRDLREKIRLAPAGLRKKVYIIDEVHMLTNEAFNALLKTLEEPPEHALFVLCTTNVEKLPETIISRCTEIDFRRAREEDLMRSLLRAKKGEDRQIEEEALTEIARKSEGSYRDAHKILEEILISFPKEKITVKMVKQVLGSQDFSGDLFSWIAGRNAQEGLLMVKKMVESGVDFKFLTQFILETLHTHLLKVFGIVAEDFPYRPELETLSANDLKRIIALLSLANQNLRTASIPQLPLELAIIEWCQEEKRVVGDSSDRVVSEVAKLARGSLPQSNLGAEALGGKWESLLTALKAYNHSVVGLLRSCRPGSFDGEQLEIEVSYKFHYDRLNQPKILELLEGASENIFGQKIKIFPKLVMKRKEENV
jgi:DNA polymerase-3 subunit gamma/tau